MKFTRPWHRAFTLIEIMIAIAIFSLVLSAIYSVWGAIMRSTQVAQDVAAQAQRQRITLRTIEDSLMAIQSFQASPQYYSFIVENGDTPTLSFTARVPEIFPRNGKFFDAITGRNFNLRRLSYSLEAGDGNQKNLVLRQNPVLMDLDADEQQFPLVLGGNTAAGASAPDFSVARVYSLPSQTMPAAVQNGAVGGAADQTRLVAPITH